MFPLLCDLISTRAFPPFDLVSSFCLCSRLVFSLLLSSEIIFEFTMRRMATTYLTGIIVPLLVATCSGFLVLYM